MTLLDENAEVDERLSKVGAEQEADGTHLQMDKKDVREDCGGDQVDDRAYAERNRALLHAKERARQLVVDGHVDAERDHQDEVLARVWRREDGLPEPARGKRCDQRPDQRRHLQCPECGLEDTAPALGILEVEEEAKE